MMKHIHSFSRRYSGRTRAALGSLCAGLALGWAVFVVSPASAYEIEPELSGFLNGVTGYVDTSEIGRHDFQFGGDAEAHLDVSMLFDNGVQTGLHFEAGLEGGTQGSQHPEGEYIEQAFVFVDTFFGKLHFGRMDGIGAQFSYVAPGLFYGSAVNDRETDLSSLNAINTVNSVRNGFDDYSLKVAYMTPRVLGLRLGASYAPDAGDCESDYCHASGFFDGVRDYDDVFEIGLDYLQSFSNGLSIGVSASYLRAGVTDNSLVFTENMNSFALGANVKFNRFTIGGSFKESNLGDSRGDYIAYDIGASYELGSWGFMVAYGADESDVGLATIGLLGSGIAQETSAVQGGVDFDYKDIVSVGGGVQYVEADRSGTGTPDDDSTVVFLETMFRF